MRTVVIIPTRMASQRLANKPLLDINGKTLIQRVYENVLAVYDAADVWIASGDQSIADHAKGFGANVIMTDPSLPSGTDRIAAALKEIDPDGTKYDIVVNFQGDGLNVDPKLNDDLIKLMRKTNADITTVAQEIADQSEIQNPGVVKIAMGLLPGARTARCLYFSRSPIPYNRNAEGVARAYWHIGIYVYNAASLRRFVSLPVGVLEDMEKLEQLRALEDGMSIYAMVVGDTRLDSRAPADVNTAEDLEEARKYIR